VRLMGVRFRPGMGAAFFGISLDELAGFHSSDWQRLGFAGMVDQLAELSREAQQLLVEQELMKRLQATQERRSPVQQLLSEITATEGRARLADLLQSVPLGQRQLERLFKEQLGTTPQRYYMELRVTEARRLLQHTELSQVDVLVACGFVSPSHFSKCYSAYFGYRPSK
ncbi:helix-turn-helix domain-containing protein, partial [Leclercia adecarboxylata]|uniref:helix-turn-helix domain-containing protein n=1 Tax=Leclercia adecarboxylata TaxID=83655 RepID=UPI00234C60F4